MNRWHAAASALSRGMSLPRFVLALTLVAGCTKAEPKQDSPEPAGERKAIEAPPPRPRAPERTRPAPPPRLPALPEHSDANPPGVPRLTGPIQSDRGTSFIDEVVGTGPAPERGQTIKVHYTGWLTDGTKFDSSIDRGEPIAFRFAVGQVIKGWDIGLASMRVGGKRRLIIPPELGYGARGAGDAIPPDATLVFDVELVAVE